MNNDRNALPVDASLTALDQWPPGEPQGQVLVPFGPPPCEPQDQALASLSPLPVPVMPAGDLAIGAPDREHLIAHGPDGMGEAYGWLTPDLAEPDPAGPDLSPCVPERVLRMQAKRLIWQRPKSRSTVRCFTDEDLAVLLAALYPGAGASCRIIMVESVTPWCASRLILTAARRAAANHARHGHTAYEALLGKGSRRTGLLRRQARDTVADAMVLVLGQWESGGMMGQPPVVSFLADWDERYKAATQELMRAGASRMSLRAVVNAQARAHNEHLVACARDWLAGRG